METNKGSEKEVLRSAPSGRGKIRLGIICFMIVSAIALVRCVPISVYAAGSRGENEGRGSRPNNPTCEIGWRRINGQLIITYVSWKHMDGLQVGDVVLSIHGVPASQAISEAEAAFSDISDPTERLGRALEHLLTTNRAYLSLMVQHNSEPAYWYSIANACAP